MADVIKPRDAKEVEEAVRWALGDDKALEVAGRAPSAASAGRARPISRSICPGSPASRCTSRRSWCSRPSAGTPLAEIEALLEKNNQQLGFEPMDYGPLFGGKTGAGHASAAPSRPISPARAASRPAPRAIISSASTAVTGRGETIKSGGRVVKNVTGYDLCKLLAGSWGTLGRHDRRHAESAAQGARPKRRVVVSGLDDARACAAMAAAMGSAFDVSGAAHLPDHVAS